MEDAKQLYFAQVTGIYANPGYESQEQFAKALHGVGQAHTQRLLEIYGQDEEAQIARSDQIMKTHPLFTSMKGYSWSAEQGAEAA